MLRRIHFLATVAVCVSSYAMAATPSIGSVTGRIDGELKIDNYSVRGSGTVFDGSVVETGPSAQSRADVRLANDSVVTLYADSRGTFYRDHFILQRGKIELGSSAAFRVEVDGLVVTPAESRASGLVSIEKGNAINVSAETGNLEVRGSSGTVVAQVRPENPLVFTLTNGGPASVFSTTGKVVADRGRYYLKSDETGVQYEVKGANVQKFVGAQVATSGALDPSPIHDNGVAATVLASSISYLGRFGLGQSAQSQSLVDGLRIARPANTNTIINCLSISENGKTESLCCKGGPYPEFCCPGQFSSGLCCSNDLYPTSKCHNSK